MTENLGGRPEHEPTEANRTTVNKMTAYGIDQETIAKCIGITRPTLHKHYRNELDKSKAECIVEVADRLISKIRADDGPSIMFYLKTQAGWREKDKDTEAEKAEKERQERINIDVQERLNAQTK